MNRCPHCDQTLPEEAPDAAFCVWCGKRITQCCPYETASSDALIPLADTAGNWQVSCPRCGRPFKACLSCGRLYRLDEKRCRTEGCGSDLVELSSAFSSNDGALDGSRSAFWSGDFKQPIRPVSVLSLKDDIRLLAYRYGQLVAVSPQNLLLFRWDGQCWIRTGCVPLPKMAECNLRSITLDDGHAFLLTSTRALIISLMDAAIYKEYDGNFLVQAKGEGVWYLFRSVSSSATELICVETTVWSEKQISLDLPGNDLVEAVTNNGLYLATLSRGILVLNQDTWQFAKVSGSEGSRFARIASPDGHLIAVGYDLDKQLQLWSSVRHTGISESKSLSQDAMAGFCVSKDKVYVAGQAGIFYLDLHSLTKVMKRIDLPAGLTTQPDLLVLTNKHGESRLIVKRIATGRAEVNMLDPMTGAISSIAVTPTPPSLCVADSKLVISSREGGEVKLRTYLSQENP